MTVFSVVNYLIYLAKENKDDELGNLKLQKLLYYCQGIYLAAQKKPLFYEELENWEHGPVVKEVYRKIKHDNYLSKSKLEYSELCENSKKIISDVYNIYGSLSAWKLRDKTHSEAPWKNTKKNEIISIKNLTTFFKEEIKYFLEKSDDIEDKASIDEHMKNKPHTYISHEKLFSNV